MPFRCGISKTGLNDICMNSYISNNISSPCIRNCSLNNCDICMGCFRTIDEIVQWNTVDEEERVTILERCQKRKLIESK